MNYAIADLFIDDWDDDWGGTSYNNSNSSPEEQEIIYDNYADFAKDFDYGFVISDGELRAGKQRFKSTYLVCMDPNGDRGIRDENCNVYCKGTLYPFFNEIDQYEVPEGVKKIGTGAFSDYVKLCSVTITDGVTTIEKEAFKNCRSLTSITIPESVTFIGEGAFSGCRSLVRSCIPDRVIAAWGNAFDDRISKASADGFRIEGHTLISYSGEGGDVTIPNGVTAIGESAFFDCYSLTSVTIPNGVTAIGESAFSNCYSLTSVTIPNGVTAIGENAFSDCHRLTSVTIPDSVMNVGESAFSYCHSLTSVTIPNSVRTIGESAFSNCRSLVRSCIPDWVIAAWGNAFDDRISKASADGFRIEDHTLISYSGEGGDVTIPNGVTAIGENAFSDCHRLTSVTIPNGVTAIGKYAFDCCEGLTSITIPNSVMNVGTGAFWGCSQARVTIPRRLNSAVMDSGMVRNIKFSD